jgi:uncharacterized phage-associated protein
MADQGSHDPRAIANKILEFAGAKNIKLTIMQLVKLVYFAHGWSLALLDRGLSKHQSQAWQYGPVFPRVYSAFKHFGARHISKLAIDAESTPFNEDFDDDELAIIDAVVDTYGHAHAYDLSNLTHKAGAPWDMVYNEAGVYAPIPDDVIQSYFRKELKIDGTIAA